VNECENTMRAYACRGVENLGDTEGLKPWGFMCAAGVKIFCRCKLHLREVFVDDAAPDAEKSYPGEVIFLAEYGNKIDNSNTWTTPVKNNCAETFVARTWKRICPDSTVHPTPSVSPLSHSPAYDPPSSYRMHPTPLGCPPTISPPYMPTPPFLHAAPPNQ